MSNEKNPPYGKVLANLFFAPLFLFPKTYVYVGKFPCRIIHIERGKNHSFVCFQWKNKFYRVQALGIPNEWLPMVQEKNFMQVSMVKSFGKYRLSFCPKKKDAFEDIKKRCRRESIFAFLLLILFIIFLLILFRFLLKIIGI